VMCAIAGLFGVDKVVPYGAAFFVLFLAHSFY
jgi:hypothetical protein